MFLHLTSDKKILTYSLQNGAKQPRPSIRRCGKNYPSTLRYLKLTSREWGKMRTQEVRDVFEKAGGLINRVILKGQLLETTRIQILERANRRLKDEVAELHNQVGSQKLIRSLRELQQDRAEQDKVIVAQQLALKWNGVTQEAVDKCVDENVFEAERAIGASRELLQRELKRLRTKEAKSQLTTRTTRKNGGPC
ncbi:hypothetical protein CYMTET_51253 [Cymbomonas tetramitiformis]|uniref:Uncharacterized protein n=1 Tax=Cymbomonas tetramitiformis TaxID=36881 RepID=A0AAE0ETX4_9CHLO|nr:hypothetical protein CYMTET_51253 [Cymbomonas tetramitiformis]